jgi:hypothetical protein
LLARAWRELDDPRSVPVATAAAELLDPETSHPSPADAVWLPLESVGGASARRELHRLLDAWPHVAPPSIDAGSESTLGSDSSLLLMAPAPAPMPPSAISRGPSTGRR